MEIVVLVLAVILVAALGVFWLTGWVIGFLNATVPGFGFLVSVLSLGALVAAIMALSEGNLVGFGICAVVVTVGVLTRRVIGSTGPHQELVHEDAPPSPRLSPSPRDRILPPPPPPVPQPDPPPQEKPQGWIGYGLPPGMDDEQPYPDDGDPVRRDQPPNTP